MHLRPLAVHLLTILLDNAGSTVPREKLRDALWGRKVVEWEPGLHRITKEIRRALGDDARAPRFVETVARRGYRFCAPIETGEPSLRTRLQAGRASWFLAGLLTFPGAILAYCVAAGLGN